MDTATTEIYTLSLHDALPILLSPGQTGEIVVRGDNVTPGYEGNPQANASALTNGWLRTGDQGFLDDEGYLFVTGRIKRSEDTRLNSSHANISYAVFCLKKKIP